MFEQLSSYDDKFFHIKYIILSYDIESRKRRVKKADLKLNIQKLR